MRRRIVNILAPIAKISLPFRKGRYRNCWPLEGTPDPEGFKVGKEECAVVPVFPEGQFQRAAEITPKVILDVLCLVCSEDAPLDGIERGISIEFVSRAVKRIRT